MKSKICVTLCAALTLVTACNQRRDGLAEREADRTTSGRASPTDYNDTLANARTNLTQTKDQFVAATREKLHQLDAKIKDLSKNSEQYRDDARAQADTALANLREKREKLSQDLEELRKSSSGAWEEMKAGFSAAMDELEKACEKAGEKFKQ